MLRNTGELDHEFILATAAENLKHAEAMKKNPEMERDDPNGKRLAPKKTGEIVWNFAKAGEFEYLGLIPLTCPAGRGITLSKPFDTHLKGQSND